MNKSERGAPTVSTTTEADDWPAVVAGRPRTDLVQSLERGLAVLRCFTRDEPALTLSEVAARTGLTRAAARRFLLTLEHLGYVTLDGRRFSLRPRVLELGYTYLSSFGLPEIAEPMYLRFVAMLREVGATVYTGRFGAMMDVELVNDGPVTLVLEK